jgi:hypothetical protein
LAGLQLPLHDDPSPMHAGRPPTGAPLTPRHVPTLLARLHAWHWPLHAKSQHTPSTHWLLWQTSALVHDAPLANLATQ